LAVVSAQERISEFSSLFETPLNSLVIIFFLLHIVYYQYFPRSLLVVAFVAEKNMRQNKTGGYTISNELIKDFRANKTR
jgi:hypothetical protein